jgi:RNA polymerase sigma-70 factor (ECF subfamily)
MDSPTNLTSDQKMRDAEFLALLSKHELALATCVHSIVPNWQDAEEVLQATRVTLWRQFDEFETGSNFLAWSRSIARNLARAHARAKARRRQVFGEEVTNLLMSQLAERPEEDDRRWRAYVDCAGQLRSESRELLRRCYLQGQKIAEIALDLGRSLAGTYKALSRLRRDLMHCVERRLREEQSE